MIRARLCDYNDAYILINGTIRVPNTAGDGGAVNNANKKVIFENCPPFTSCITKISNAKVVNAEDIDIVMPMYDLLVQR